MIDFTHSTLRRFLLACSVATVTACSGANLLPTQTAPTAFPPESRVAPNAADPCQTLSKQGVWYFHGSCLAAIVRSSKTTFRLKPYKGVIQTVQYPSVSGSVPPKTVLVTGEAAGTRDVTGKFMGKSFPIFGSKKVPCLNGSGSPQTCPGKVILYDLLVNGTTNSVTFTGSPSFALRAPAVLKHQRSCILNQMIQAGSGFAYEETPVAQFVKAGKVTLSSNPSPFNMNSHTVEVFAISCLPLS